MPNTTALEPFALILALEPVDRTRRNHGLEHATLTLLAHKYRGLSLVGRSTPYGFYLYGHVNTDALTEAAHAALERMRNGEVELAVHPNCGTNFVTAGIVAGLAAYLGFLGANSGRSRWSRLPIVTLLCTVALIFAQPLGLALQQYITTSGEVGEMEIVGIERRERGNLVTHFVTTRG